MRPTQHISNNLVLGAPHDWKQEELTCTALAVTTSEFDGVPCVKSYWFPSAEELVALQNGHMVELTIFGRSMPPVMINVLAEK